MLAYKSTTTISDKKLSIILPDYFNNKQVEIIILLKYPEQIQNGNIEEQKRQNLLALLADAPQWDTVQEAAFSETKNFMQSWE